MSRPATADTGCAGFIHLSSLASGVRALCGAENNMAMISIGIGLLVLTVVLFRWGVPRNGQPSRVPNKWGLSTAFPIAVMCLGVFGLCFCSKDFSPEHLSLAKQSRVTAIAP
jgi:hypothetical protein